MREFEKPSPSCIRAGLSGYMQPLLASRMMKRPLGVANAVGEYPALVQQLLRLFVAAMEQAEPQESGAVGRADTAHSAPGE
jgi:hypothetical protein